ARALARAWDRPGRRRGAWGRRRPRGRGAARPRTGPWRSARSGAWDPPGGRPRNGVRSCYLRTARRKGLDHGLEAVHGAVEHVEGGAEGEAEVAAEARGAAGAALAGVDVEELAGDGDDLVLEGGAEEGHAVGQRGGEVGDGHPGVEGAIRVAVAGEAEGA